MNKQATFALIIVIIVTMVSLVSGASNKNLAGDTAANHVMTDEVEAGVLASQTLTIATSAATQMGTLTSGTKIVEVVPSVDVNWGGAGVPTGTGYMLISANTSKTFKVATTTPAIYFRGKTTTGTVNVIELK